MMKKRITISVLTLLFLVSTTGLPIYSHYCEMMGKRSSNECEMCKAEIEKTEPSCCSENNIGDALQLKAENSRCCVDEFDYKKIEDNFSQSSNTIIFSLTPIIAESNHNSVETELDKKYSQNSNYNLPPPKFGKYLLQTIHQLKLDFPVC